jgi:hypothetical protein
VVSKTQGIFASSTLKGRVRERWKFIPQPEPHTESLYEYDYNLAEADVAPDGQLPADPRIRQSRSLPGLPYPALQLDRWDLPVVQSSRDYTNH